MAGSRKNYQNQNKNTKDLYAILGVPRDADAGQIKKAYRKLAKKYHPDSNAGNAEAEKRFKDVSEANAILGDEEKRKIYDEFGYDAFDSGLDPKEYAQRMREARRAGAGGFGGFGGPAGGSGGFSSFRGFGGSGFGGSGFGGFGGFGSGGSGSGEDDVSDLFEQLFRSAGSGAAGSGSRFSQSRGTGAGYGSSGRSSGFSQERVVSLDAEIPVRLSFAEAALGCDRSIRLQREDGSGTQTLRVHIPAGIDDGKSVRLRGKGHVSADGSRRGDLLLKVSVEDSRTYSRKGNHLYTTTFVPFTTAVLGGEAEVKLLDGKSIFCKVPRGTDAGKKIRIRGKGIRPEKDGGQPGDLYVTVQVQVPKDLSEAEIRKLREFEAMLKSAGKS